MGRTIRDVVSSARSKNAGPFTVTMDLFFPDLESFHEIADAGILTRELVAGIYSLTPDQVKIFPFEPARAIKVSIPRLVPGGAPGDRDVAGGQQFAPLLDI